MLKIVEIKWLMERLQSSFDSITNRPAILHPRTLLLVTDIFQTSRSVIVVNGFIAEFLIDSKTSVIPTNPDDELQFEDILVPEQEFVLEMLPAQNAKFIKFCGRIV